MPPPLLTSETWAQSGCRKYLGAELMFALAGWPGKTGGGEGHPVLGCSPCEPKPTQICKVQPNFIPKLGFATTPHTLCVQSHKWPLVQSKVQAPPRHHPAHPEDTGSSQHSTLMPNLGWQRILVSSTPTPARDPANIKHSFSCPDHRGRPGAWKEIRKQ